MLPIAVYVYVFVKRDMPLCVSVKSCYSLSVCSTNCCHCDHTPDTDSLVQYAGKILNSQYSISVLKLLSFFFFFWQRLLNVHIKYVATTLIKKQSLLQNLIPLVIMAVNEAVYQRFCHLEASRALTLCLLPTYIF